MNIFDLALAVKSYHLWILELQFSKFSSFRMPKVSKSIKVVWARVRGTGESSYLLPSTRRFCTYRPVTAVAGLRVPTRRENYINLIDLWKGVREKTIFANFLVVGRTDRTRSGRQCSQRPLVDSVANASGLAPSVLHHPVRDKRCLIYDGCAETTPKAMANVAATFELLLLLLFFGPLAHVQTVSGVDINWTDGRKSSGPCEFWAQRDIFVQFKISHIYIYI